MNEEDKITFFGETDFRNKKTRFGIKAKDRTRHIYVIGKTGMGKSTLLENLAIQDIQNDEGIIFIDPHGSTAAKLLEYVPHHRIDDVVYFAPHDSEFPIAFNVLEQVPREKRNAVAGGLISAFKKIWVDSFSSRMEYLLNYTLLALLDVPGSTMLGINRLLADKVYRKYIIDRVEDSLVKTFWTTEFEKYSTSYATEAVAPIQNKVGQFIASPMIRNIIGQEVSTIDFRTFMDQKKIVIINISKGIIGPENMRLLGGMLITKIQLAAMSRANLSEESLKRIPNTYLYVDEFQNFANESFAEILSESRKYKLALTVANQYIDQMTEEVRNAVIGNVGTFISYRVGSTDGEIMEKEFAPAFLAEDMVNLGMYQMYLKLMIDGVASRPFSASGMPPIPRPEKSYVEDIIGYSRKHFANEREGIEAEIKKWSMKDYNLEMQANSGSNSVGQIARPKLSTVSESEKRIEQPRGRDNQRKRNDADKRPTDQPRNLSNVSARMPELSDEDILINLESTKPTQATSRPQVKTEKVERVAEKREDKKVENKGENVVGNKEEKVIKEIEKIIKKVERQENLARKKAYLNSQKIHKMQIAKRPDSLDEVPEDVLKALLDIGDL